MKKWCVCVGLSELIDELEADTNMALLLRQEDPDEAMFRSLAVYAFAKRCNVAHHLSDFSILILDNYCPPLSHGIANIWPYTMYVLYVAWCLQSSRTTTFSTSSGVMYQQSV